MCPCSNLCLDTAPFLRYVLKRAVLDGDLSSIDSFVRDADWRYLDGLGLRSLRGSLDIFGHALALAIRRLNRLSCVGKLLYRLRILRAIPCHNVIANAPRLVPGTDLVAFDIEDPGRSHGHNIFKFEFVLHAVFAECAWVDRRRWIVAPLLAARTCRRKKSRKICSVPDNLNIDGWWITYLRVHAYGTRSTGRQDRVVARIDYQVGEAHCCGRLNLQAVVMITVVVD